MRRRALIGALALVGIGVFLGATVFREGIAQAAQAISANIVGPLDAGGNVKVHEQGTALVHVTNGGVPVEPAGTPVTIDASAGHSYTVPANTRLVVQYVNSIYDDPDDLGIATPLIIGSNRIYWFIGRLAAASGSRVVSDPVTILASSGEILHGSANHLSLSGYLIDVPTRG